MIDQREIVVEIDLHEVEDWDDSFNFIKEYVRPWLDELDKDDVEYDNLSFYIVEDPKDPWYVKIHATVDLPQGE